MPQADVVAGVAVRPALLDDLAAAARVYVVADDELDHRLHGRSLRDEPAPGAAPEADALADFARLRAACPDAVWVADAAGEVVGVAAVAIWGRHWYLHSLFVLPAWQGRGLGRALLERAHAVGRAAGCDVFSLHASDDPRALTRYLALGLVPQPPTVDFHAEAAGLRFPDPPRDDDLESHPLRPDDPAALATLGDLDRTVRGVHRPELHARLLADGATGALLTRRDSGTPAGYFLVSADDRAGRIGPAAALDEARFATVLTRALAAARALARPGLPWRASVPGQNRAAVAPLLTAGFRPRRLSAYLSSAPIGRFDRYLFRDEDEL